MHTFPSEIGCKVTKNSDKFYNYLRFFLHKSFIIIYLINIYARAKKSRGECSFAPAFNLIPN